MPTQQDRIRAAIALLSQAADGPGPTFTALWATWWEAKRHELDAADTEIGRAAHLLAVFGGRDVLTITATDIDEYRAARRQAGSAPATRNHEVKLARRVCGYALKRGRISRNPFAGAEMEPENNIRRGRVDGDADLARILRWCRPWVAAAVLALYDTGARRKEVHGLRWDEIDGDGLVTIPAERSKTGAVRTVRLTTRALAAVRALPRRSPFVFASPETGRPYAVRWLYELYQKAVTRSGLQQDGDKRLVMHSLRHSFAYVARRRYKLPDRLIMRMGGWKSREAYDRYGQPDDDEAADGWSIVERFTRGPRKGPQRATRADSVVSKKSQGRK